jgi:NAD(P)-dependent dehydrogenase (short-subunit alcohol dehydrogenase family)
VNVVGLINTINTFLPLVKKSSIKKILFISSGMADADLVNGGVIDSAPYSISKAAANMAIFKYNAKYKDQGVLIFAISPGVVATRDGLAESKVIKTLQAAMPHWPGPLTPVESAEMVLKVLHDFSLEKGNGGAFVSHFGNKQWL